METEPGKANEKMKKTAKLPLVRNPDKSNKNKGL